MKRIFLPMTLVVLWVLFHCYRTLSASDGATPQPPVNPPDLKQLLTDLKNPDTQLAAIVALADFGPQASPAIPDLIAAVRTNNEDLRLNAAIALGKIGKEAVPAVAKLLDAIDEDTRYYAISALGWIGPDAQETTAAIIKALADKSDSIRRKAAFTLGRIDPKADVAIPVLISALNDSNEDVRAAASESLGRFGAAAVPGLIETMKEKKTPQSLYAARAVAEIGPPAQDAIAVLKAWLYVADGDWRHEAQEALSKIGKPAINVLVEAIKDTDAATRSAAINALGKIGADAVLDLVDALGSKHVDVRRAAAMLLMPLRVNDKMVVLAFAYGLEDADEIVRLHCAQALQQLGPLAALASPKLKGALLDVNPNVRNTAYFALTSMNVDPRAILKEHLQEKDARTRIIAAALLMTTSGDKEAIPVLRDGLKLKDQDLQLQAAFALAQHGQNAKETAPIFIQGLKSKSIGIREQAIQGLQILGPGGSEASLLLLDIMQNDPEPNLRTHAMHALQNVGGDPKLMLPPLKKMLNDPNAGVRLAAVQVIWRYGSETIPLLIERMEDKDLNVRQHAIWMLNNVQPDKNALPHIKPLLKHKNNEVRQAAVQLLSRSGAAAFDDLVALLKDTDENIRWQAFHGLRNSKGSANKLLPLLNEIIKDEKPGTPTRGFAVQALAQLGPEGWPTLFEALKTETNPHVRANAIIHLGNLGPKSKDALPFLIDALSDKSPEVRSSALSALQNMGPNAKPAIPQLVLALKDDDANVRNQVMFALQTQGKDGLSAVAKSLATGNTTSRTMAFQLFQNSNYRDKEMVPGLIECLKDKTAPVRIQACLLLGQLGSEAKEAIPALRELSNDPDQTARNFAQDAIRSIEGKIKWSPSELD